MFFSFCSHHNIWRDAGVQIGTYRYYNPKTKGLDFNGFMEDVMVRVYTRSCTEEARILRFFQSFMLGDQVSNFISGVYFNPCCVQNAPSGSVFLLHACAHNPTGVDPTADQWRDISALFKVHEIIKSNKKGLILYVTVTIFLFCFFQQ